MDREKARAAARFYKDEISDMNLYRALAKAERKKELRSLFNALAGIEGKHARMWLEVLKDEGMQKPSVGASSLRILKFGIVSRILGSAFVTRILEEGEIRAIEAYSKTLGRVGYTARERKRIRSIIDDEKNHEEKLVASIKESEGDLNYVRSIVFGLNDGLVELLAVIAGLAVVIQTPILVAIGGLIVGVSGTLSMAAGAYLSSKSHILVEDSAKNAKDHVDTKPAKDALYTGLFYFIGAIISILPFMFGLSGFAGILASIVLVSIALVIASTIIALISNTSIKTRIAEMLIISLGTAFVTIILGTILKQHFGISA